MPDQDNESVLNFDRKSSATLENVAETAGVSLATASRCLNRPESVRADKRERILNAVEQLNYVPHGAARALASKRTRMIGAVLPSLDSALFGGLLDVFEKAVAQAGYSVLVASSGYDPDRERTHIRNLLESGVEALLLVGSSRDPAIYDLIKARQIPYILAWSYNHDDQHAYAGFDNAAAAEHLTDYLLSLGHQRFGVISGLPDNNDRVSARLHGIRRALEKQNLEIGPNHLFEASFSVENGQDAFRSMMTGPQPPTAIICGSAPFAYGSLFEADSMGIKVPDRVSVAGFDDMWLAPYINPPLTTVRTPRFEMGELAARYLTTKLEGDVMAPPRPLEIMLVVRKSTGPPPPA